MPKYRTNYDAIKQSAVLFIKDHKAFKSFIGSLYAFSLKGLSWIDDRDIKILLTDMQALGQPNQAYCDWRDDYNLYDAAQYKVFLADDKNFAETIKNLRGILNNGAKKTRKAKDRRCQKQAATRLYKDIRDVCTDASISEKKEEHFTFCLALQVASFAYKETMINIRYRLSSNLYDLIPEKLFIATTNGERHSIKNLYNEFKINSTRICYKLNHRNLSNDDLRNIQLELCPYIFKSIYEKQFHRRPYKQK